MLSFLILKWEDDLLWKRFKNIELIYETWSREVWFFSPIAHTLTFSLVYFVLWKRYIYIWSVFVLFLAPVLKLIEKKPILPPTQISVWEKYWHTFMLPQKINWPLASESLWDLREWDKKLCVCQCVFFSSWFCTIFAYNFKTETHFKHQYQKLTFSLRCTSLNSYIVFIFLRDFCSFKLRSQFLCTKMNKNWLSK